MTQIFFLRGRGFSRGFFFRFLHGVQTLPLSFFPRKKGEGKHVNPQHVWRKGSAHKLGRFCACAVVPCVWCEEEGHLNIITLGG